MTDIKLIDSHAHIDFDSFDEDIDQVLERAKDAGVCKIVCAGTTVEGSISSHEMALKHPHIYSSAGVHPHEAGDVNEETYEKIKTLAHNEKVIAIGEVGLDYHYKNSPREIQREVFARFITLAKNVNLPLIIHTRKAEEDTLKLLKENEAGKAGGVIHCFSGSLDMAKKCLKMGFYISIPGIVTFKKAANLEEIVKYVPIERMLIETDAPYLAPTPFRGKRNEPAYVKYVAEKIAQIKDLSIEDVARITTLNAEELFGIGDKVTNAEIAYKIRNSLYLNITNLCTNSCPFCPKFKDFKVKGHYLELKNEPTTAEIIKAIGDPSPYNEVVFCGFGEPLLRIEAVKEISQWLKEKGVKVRINTDGLANAVHKRNILPELKGLIDSISVSLNADNSALYDKVCKPPFSNAFDAVKEFIIEAKKHIPDVTASVVGLPNVNVEKCKYIAENELGVKFRLRPYNEVG